MFDRCHLSILQNGEIVIFFSLFSICSVLFGITERLINTREHAQVALSESRQQLTLCSPSPCCAVHVVSHRTCFCCCSFDRFFVWQIIISCVLKLQKSTHVIMPLITGHLLASVNLSCIIVTFIYWLLVSAREQNITYQRYLVSLIITSIVAARGYLKGNVNTSGCIAGCIVGFTLSMANYCFIMMMITFFLTSSYATKFKFNVKCNIDREYSKHGARNWIQVLCNGGIAAHIALVYLIHCGPSDVHLFSDDRFTCKLIVAVIASISCVFGDTLSSEIGSAVSSGRPRLITTFKCVPRGTNGAVSLTGLLASVAAGLLISLTYGIFDVLFCHSIDRMIRIAFVSLIAVSSSLGGSLIDSLLGATLQLSGVTKDAKITDDASECVSTISGIPLLDNHAVNLISCAICTAAAPSLVAHILH